MNRPNNELGSARTVFIAAIAFSALSLGGMALMRGDSLIEMLSRSITQWVVPFNAMIMFGFAVIIAIVAGTFIHYYLFELKTGAMLDRDSAHQIVARLKVRDQTAPQRHQEAAQLLQRDETVFGAILRRFVNLRGLQADQPSKLWQSVQDEEFDRIKRNLMYFSLASVLAPAMGFLGTAVGMVAAFYQISIKDHVTPADLATSIQIALITTVVGLVIKTIAMLLKTAVIHSIGRREDQMVTAYQQLLER